MNMKEISEVNAKEMFTIENVSAGAGQTRNMTPD